MPSSNASSASLRQEADAEVDALFPADRLRAQQQEDRAPSRAIGRAARVISFPGSTAGPPHHPSTTRLAMRWIAGAAAAGLFVGSWPPAPSSISARGSSSAMRGRGGHRSADDRARPVARRPRPYRGRPPWPPRRSPPRRTTCSCRRSIWRSIGRTSRNCRLDALTPHVRELDCPGNRPSVGFAHLPQGPRPQGCVAGMLAGQLPQRPRRADPGRRFPVPVGPPGRPPRAGVRLLLRRGPRRRLRLSDAGSGSPTARVFLTGEIIHNPHVNEKLRAMGIEFMGDERRQHQSPRQGRRRDPAGIRRHSRACSKRPRRGAAARSSTRRAVRS